MQKKIAVEYMSELDLDPNAIAMFEHGEISLFKDGYVLPITDGIYMDKIVELEEKRKVKVYAVVTDGDMFPFLVSFLNVSPYGEDWGKEIRRLTVDKSGGTFAVNAFVWNLAAPECSESGSVILKVSNDGFPVRIG